MIAVSLYVKCIRPQHWTKNLLIFAAPFTAGRILNIEDLSKLLITFLFFCVASSTNYVLNDWLDQDFDAKHYQKLNRPFAAKKLGKESFIWLMILLLLCQLTLSFQVEFKAFVWVIAYLLFSISYSLYLKQIPVIEMFWIVIGFIIRAVAGAETIGVRASSWFLIVIGFGALFMVSNKRLAEMDYQNSFSTRKVLNVYSPSFLKTIVGSSLSVSLVGFALWAFQVSNQTSYARISALVFTMAMTRYLWISEYKNAEQPEVLLFTDKVLIMLGIALLILLALAIYS
jgi:decaprenyl-phosphate phosphoribosyltransferase